MTLTWKNLREITGKLKEILKQFQKILKQFQETKKVLKNVNNKQVSKKSRKFVLFTDNFTRNCSSPRQLAYLMKLLNCSTVGFLLNLWIPPPDKPHNFIPPPTQEHKKCLPNQFLAGISLKTEYMVKILWTKIKEQTWSLKSIISVSMRSGKKNYRYHFGKEFYAL